ncbi:4-coumarate--CoA ligase-like 5 [Papilio xuthus]|uniref:4-coumarate--CoA ligase-like 5 n=1 Tax=Papilio xuthus TaxID=66420 RepID=A0A0N0PEY0_PAPXU|nr:4-coumarate--CoA ligase-like 5 [Papilio xuthus]
MFYTESWCSETKGYGLTETNGGVSVGRKTDVNHATVGYLFGSCAAKIIDVNTQQALGPGEVKGFQVPPAELETILRTHPKIMDCAVIGVPDHMTGEAPKAFVVAQKDITTDEIKQYVNNQLVAFKHIKEVQFVDEIPKNPAGKVLRKDLKAKYC